MRELQVAMLFTDWKFFVFFAIAFGVYWSLTANLPRKLWLLACSMVFYAAWDWRFSASSCSLSPTPMQ